MALNRITKIEELKEHLKAIAVIAKELKSDREYFQEDDGWIVPGPEFSKLNLTQSPVSDEEVFAWLKTKDEAIVAVHEREELMKVITSVTEVAMKVAPLLLAL